MDVHDLQMLADSGALNVEQLAEVKSLLHDIAAEDNDHDAAHRLREAGLPLVGPALAPRERNVTGMDALAESGVPLIESETVQLADLPVVEQLAAMDGIGDERAAAMSEASGVPLRGGHTFLGAERALRAAFGEPGEAVSADEVLRLGGIPMAEATAASSAGALQRAAPSAVVAKLHAALPDSHVDKPAVVALHRAGAALDHDQLGRLADLSEKHAGLLEGIAPDTSGLADAESAEEVLAAIDAPLGESEARGLLAAGGVPMMRLGT